MAVSNVLRVAVLAVVLQVASGKYVRNTTISGDGFYKAFDFQNITDPSGGNVTYVDGTFAESANLTFASGTSFIARVDATTTLSATDGGRNSVRLRSNATYTTHVAVFDIRHVPEGCGTWPAVWEAGDNYPETGEVDIMEGVNNKGTNVATLHTDAGCSMPSNRNMTGTETQDDCSVYTDEAYTGCGVTFPEANSYGPDFNAVGGGWYAVERTAAFIKVWFWSRNSTSVPKDVSSGSKSVNPSNWGTPQGYWPNSSTCDIATHFGPHHILINIDLCGSYAGSSSVYGADGCPGTCADYVNSNPTAFANAYFDFASISIYNSGMRSMGSSSILFAVLSFVASTLFISVI
ncbi:glycoside hydrolase family 16 protein [Plicaturopsis crispa FD-325 SS-3]|nr:glycoside hydrolase family 16 protein [Plicaturopsis crispa FD-325 SS-3]